MDIGANAAFNLKDNWKSAVPEFTGVKAQTLIMTVPVHQYYLYSGNIRIRPDPAIKASWKGCVSSQHHQSRCRNQQYHLYSRII